MYFLPTLKFIYVLWPLAICTVSIQERFLIKSGLEWRAYSKVWIISDILNSLQLIHFLGQKECILGCSYKKAT